MPLAQRPPLVNLMSQVVLANLDEVVVAKVPYPERGELLVGVLGLRSEGGSELGMYQLSPNFWRHSADVNPLQAAC